MNKLVDKYNNSSHTGKKSINADYSALSKNIELHHKTFKFKVGGRVRIIKQKNIFSKFHTKNWSKEIFVIDSVL